MHTHIRTHNETHTNSTERSTKKEEEKEKVTSITYSSYPCDPIHHIVRSHFSLFQLKFTCSSVKLNVC